MRNGEEERRKYKRIPTRVRITCKPVGVEGESEISSLDISAGGFSMMYPDVVKPDTIFELKVCLPDNTDSFFCLAKVVRQADKAVKQKDGKLYYETGLKFEDMDLKNRLRLIYYVHNKLKLERKERS
jgi:c-di-GMP-binding flagellar brake protein YcgR